MAQKSRDYMTQYFTSEEAEALLPQIRVVLLQIQEHRQTLQALVAELEEFGCVLKDPDVGLIDFLSLRNGREIYLCWLLGEERINYWHYLDAGFAGRQPL